ncbi:MAG: BACON domain-containing protein [Prevotella sp.]|nr:BACON domain-containing protein [Prevotella sp.]
MNRIFSFVLLLAGTLTFTACGDDDEVGQEYTRENPVSVTSSDLTFTADGGKGGVKFTAPAGATVSTNVDWATAEMVGSDSAVVTVGVNAKLGGRGAKLTIKCGNDSTNIPITQTGSSFKLSGSKEFYLNDNDTVISLRYFSEGVPAKVTSSNDEAVTGTEFGDSTVNITLAANGTGSFRTSEVYFNNDGRVDTVFFVQGSENDLLNKQYIIGGIDLMTYSQTQNIQQSVFVELGTLVKSGGHLYFQSTGMVSGVPMQIPLIYGNDLSLTLTAGNRIGSIKQNSRRFNLVTGVVDYNALNATYDYEEAHGATQGALSNLFLNSKLSLTAFLSVGTDGIHGAFQDTGANQWFVTQYGSKLKFNSFSGQFAIGAVSGNSVAGWYKILLSSSIEEYRNSGGAKENQLSAVRSRIAAKMASQLPVLGRPLFPVIGE